MLYVRFRFLAFKLTLSAIYFRLPFLSARGATLAGCEVKLVVWGTYRNAIFIHARISSLTVPLLWLSGVNY